MLSSSDNKSVISSLSTETTFTNYKLPISIFKSPIKISRLDTFKHNLPPNDFINSISSTSVKNKSNLVLLIWILNSPDLDLTNNFQIGHNPLILFESSQLCYIDLFYLRKKMNQTQIEILEISIFPQITQLNYKFQMNILCFQYYQQFLKVLHNYKSKKKKALYLISNLIRLLKAYIKDISLDIWWKFVNYSGDQVLEFEDLLNLLEHKFVIDYDDVGYFINKMNSAVRLIQSSITFGIWLDSFNGIMLLCNGFKDDSNNVKTLPIKGFNLLNNLYDENSDYFVKSILLFTNIALCQFFKDSMGTSFNMKRIDVDV